MKKLFSTAISLIAFSFVSSANTINENETKNVITFNESSKFNANMTVRCDGIWGSVRLYALNQHFSPDQASCIAMAALIACLGLDATEVKKEIGSLC